MNDRAKLFVTLLIPSVLALGCSGPQNPCPSGNCPNEAGVADGGDASGDGARDAATDIANDMATDVPADAVDVPQGSDAPVDVASDVASDALADALSDARTDASGDVAMLDASGDGGCNPCLNDDTQWGFMGGFIASHDLDSIFRCNSYQHTRTTGGSTTMCMDAILCAGTISTADINNAINDPDVQAALAMGTVRYGRMPLPDVSVFTIVVGGNTIRFGSACMGLAGCTDPPPGVQRLRTLLENLAAQQDSMPACTAVFGSG
jgi:hypothetical protein